MYLILLILLSIPVFGAPDSFNQYLAQPTTVWVGTDGSFNKYKCIASSIAVSASLETFNYYNMKVASITLSDGTPFDPNPPTSITATGGDITDSGGQRIHTFSANGTFSVSAGVTASGKVLIVAGGGGGGAYRGGGGGAGGYIYLTGYSLSVGDYNIIVGTNGIGGIPPGGQAALGNDGMLSTFSTMTAIGGGGAGGGEAVAPYWGRQPKSGGSGGGGAAGQPGWTGAAGTTGQGYAGGDGGTFSAPYYAGGGGGATAVGTNGGPGHGGAGLLCTITGANITYAGGGGGGHYQGSAGDTGNGGAGGGGNSGHYSDGSAGTNGLGGGGGGAGSDDDTTVRAGGNGGSGVVIIAYPYP